MTEPAEFLYSPAAVREMDAFAIGALGIDGLELMERAGRAAFSGLRAHWPQARKVLVVCGVGNNAGDGYVVARLALEAGLAVQVLQLGDSARLRNDAARAAERYASAGGARLPFLGEDLAAADVVVDAIFGTGLDRPVQGEWASAIDAINVARRAVLALDIPSGLQGATGSILGGAVRADLTVTFIARKAGLYTGAGPACAGEILLDDLSLPASVLARAAPCGRLLREDDVARSLPPRPRDAHKGLFGHVLVIGGERGFGGAVRMAAEAAARVGAGLVTVATRAAHVSGMLAARPELMVGGVETAEDLEPLLARASVVALGPGLGQGPWGRALFDRALRYEGPVVVDADGLNLLAASPRRRADWVLTPHPGEAARLLGANAKRVQGDRFTVAEQLAAQYGGVIILKGAGTLVQEAGLPWVAQTGNPGMASGGMGDVLTGVVAGLIAQGLSAADAARAGVHVHGAAADAAAEEGERGLLAGDLMPHLRRLVNP